MMARKLVMKFKTVGGRTSTLVVDEPKEDITEAEVRAVMEDVIAKNVFNTKSGDLVETVSAEVITTTEQVLVE
jgi:hypothetical protein